MLEAVSAGITFAIDELRADWVMRLRIDISPLEILPARGAGPARVLRSPEPGRAKERGPHGQGLRHRHARRAMHDAGGHAPHRWDRYVAGASPIEQLMEDRTRAHCAFRHAPVALLNVKPGDRDGARGIAPRPGLDVHLRQDGDGRRTALWHRRRPPGYAVVVKLRHRR